MQGDAIGLTAKVVSASWHWRNRDHLGGQRHHRPQQEANLS